MASDGRKSLMLTAECHGHLMRLAQNFDVTQQELVDGMIQTVDKVRLAAALQEIVSKRKATAAEAAAKRKLLEDLTAGMTVGQLEKLLSDAKNTR